MAQSPAFIGIDWGTSNARFMLVDGDGNALDQRNGPGIGQLTGKVEIESTCFANIAGWLESGPEMPVIMAGMVGSNIGWQVADYVETPASAAAIAARLIRFECRGRQFCIIPGLATRRDDGLPDTMRGEETQILGAASGPDGLFCLPGTHSKWVSYQDEKITGFHTSLTGELLDIVACHSILLSERKAIFARPSEEFHRGVAASHRAQMGLESLLFSVRGRQLVGTLEEGAAGDYLAGLIIGSEVRSALTQHGGAKLVTLVGSSELGTLYSAALQSYDLDTQWFDGDQASLRGLYNIYRSLR